MLLTPLGVMMRENSLQGGGGFGEVANLYGTPDKVRKIISFDLTGLLWVWKAFFFWGPLPPPHGVGWVEGEHFFSQGKRGGIFSSPSKGFVWEGKHGPTSFLWPFLPRLLLYA